MGLLAGMAKTAVVAGTATASRNAVNRHAAKKNVAAYSEAQDAANAEHAQRVPVGGVVAAGKGKRTGLGQCHGRSYFSADRKATSWSIWSSVRFRSGMPRKGGPSS